MNQSLKTIYDVWLYVLISSNISKKSALETLQDVIRGGADAVQLREKGMANKEYFALAQQFRQITAESNTLFIVNDHTEIVKEVNADGLHIGQSDMSIPTARKILGNDKIIGCSTHNIIQARKAESEGADYISVGPLFHTTTKDYEPSVGIEYLIQVKKEISIPFVAIGAINMENIEMVQRFGRNRIAICSAIICSDDIEGTTRALKKQLMHYEQTACGHSNRPA